MLTDTVPEPTESGMSALHSAAAAVGEQSIIVSLEGLSEVVGDESSPSQEDAAQYLEKVALIKKRNSIMAMLNLLDELIDMSVSGKITKAEIDNDIPDNIIVTLHGGDFMTEYIQAGITKKWATLHFQEDKDRYVITVRSQTLVEVVDKQTVTFDLFGLFVKYSATHKCNRIVPKFIAKSEPVEPKPRQTGNYSSFRGSHAIKRPLIPVLLTIQAPQQKVSKKLLNFFYCDINVCVKKIVFVIVIVSTIYAFQKIKVGGNSY